MCWPSSVPIKQSVWRLVELLVLNISSEKSMFYLNISSEKSVEPSLLY